MQHQDVRIPPLSLPFLHECRTYKTCLLLRLFVLWPEDLSSNRSFADMAVTKVYQVLINTGMNSRSE